MSIKAVGGFFTQVLLTRGQFYYIIILAAFIADIFPKGCVSVGKKLKLYGFNNLTKTLSFNIYDVCYAKEQESRKNI